MPDKIKDLRNRNEEVSRLIEDAYANQTTLGSGGGSNSYFQPNNYLQQHGSNLQGSLYNYAHQSSGATGVGFSNQQLSNASKAAAAAAAAVVANESHDFEDFLNLVITKLEVHTSF